MNAWLQCKEQLCGQDCLRHGMLPDWVSTQQVKEPQHVVQDCNLLDAADNGGQATAWVQPASSWQNVLISSRWD